MATVQSLRKRYQGIQDQFAQHSELISQVQQQAATDILHELAEEFPDDPIAFKSVTSFIGDQITVFRFCRRGKFDLDRTLLLLSATLRWRLTVLEGLSYEMLPKSYCERPPLFFHPDLHDKIGRPAAIVNLQNVLRDEEGSLNSVKNSSKLDWDTARKWLTDMSLKDPEHPQLQMVVLVDLAGAGLANLEIELLPFFLDLLKNHFPGMVGAIIILNYGWTFSGMWQIAKRILPATALERIIFPTQAELFEFFEPEHLLEEHGGLLQYSYTSENPVRQNYGQRFGVTRQLSMDFLSYSRSTSADSFYSFVDSGPNSFTSSRRSSFGSTSSMINVGLENAASFTELSDILNSSDIGEDEEEEVRFRQVTEYRDGGDPNGTFMTKGDTFTIQISGTTSRTDRQSVRSLDSRDVSPYNLSNPYYGYPVFLLPRHLDPVGVPRPRHVRRRKRDLIKTLSYLFIIRLLSLYRRLHFWTLSLVNGKKNPERESKVHFEEPPVKSTPTSILKKRKTDKRNVDIRVVYLLLIVIAFRAPFLGPMLRSVFVQTPLLVTSPLRRVLATWLQRLFGTSRAHCRSAYESLALMLVYYRDILVKEFKQRENRGVLRGLKTISKLNP